MDKHRKPRTQRLISDEDRSLFREAVGKVRRIHTDTIAPSTPRLAAIPRHSEADEAEVLREMFSDMPHWSEMDTGEELFFARPGLQNRVIRKLRLGQYAVEAELDLHGMTVRQANEALSWFLRECARRDTRCVRIIHGKGKGSQHLPVLKAKVNRWLRLREEVMAFSSAPPWNGGTGALLALLSHRNRSRIKN
ncbi:MAG: Smr/MutS family protein [Chromatiales bacterium]|nr:Smr/MutS family protein [Chromatiales bacterium]